MTRERKCIVSIGIILAMLVTTMPLHAAVDVAADPHTHKMPISWDQACNRLITCPDEAKLENGEVLVETKWLDGGIIEIETMNLIDAKPEECARVVRDYDHYTTIMPYTVESKIIRSFRIEGQSPAPAYDFWSSVSVLGYRTRYLVRMVHLDDPENHRYRAFWTLVQNPSADTSCSDCKAKPCDNDLQMNVGTSEFESYKGDPERTINTYTVRVKTSNWLQYFGMRVECRNTMRCIAAAVKDAIIQRR